MVSMSGLEVCAGHDGVMGMYHYQRKIRYHIFFYFSKKNKMGRCLVLFFLSYCSISFLTLVALSKQSEQTTW